MTAPGFQAGNGGVPTPLKHEVSYGFGDCCGSAVHAQLRWQGMAAGLPRG